MKLAAALLPLVCLGLTACIYLPHTEAALDPSCGVLERKMSLTVTEVGLYGRCANEGCIALLVGAGAVSAATAVVSGSVVVVGNAVYWLEKQGRCLSEKWRTPPTYRRMESIEPEPRRPEETPGASGDHAKNYRFSAFASASQSEG